MSSLINYIIFFNIKIYLNKVDNKNESCKKEGFK